MGESHTKGLGYMADASDAAALTNAYKEARNAIQHQAGIEKAVVRSASVLWTDVAAGQKKTAAFEPLIDARAGSLLNEVKAAYQLQAAQRTPASAAAPATGKGAGASVAALAPEPVMTADEKEASTLIVEQIPQAPGTGFGGGGGGGGGGGQRPTGPALPDEFTAEFSLLTAKTLTALQIRDFLSGEFTPLPMADVMAVIRAQEKAGRLKVTAKPAEAPAKGKKK